MSAFKDTLVALYKNMMKVFAPQDQPSGVVARFDKDMSKHDENKGRGGSGESGSGPKMDKHAPSPFSEGGGGF